jgi:hypothetical protein
VSPAREEEIMSTKGVVGVVAWLTVSLWLATGVYAAEHGYRQVVDGVVVYFGIMPAQVVRGHHPPRHPEGEMHDGAPAGENHVMVALFDQASGRRITEAEVSATVSGRGMKRLSKRLEPMTVAGALTYGNYFAMPGAGPYRIDVEIRRPDTARVLRASFTSVRS